MNTGHGHGHQLGTRSLTLTWKQQWERALSLTQIRPRTTYTVTDTAMDVETDMETDNN